MGITRKIFLRSILGMLGTGIWLRTVQAFGRGDIHFPTRALGHTGLRVTPIGIGATRTREPALLRAAFDRGINFIDTGRAYGNGQNEAMIGRVLKGIRDRFVIQSKIYLPGEDGAGIRDKKLAGELMKLTEESLQALQTDRVDVMLLHSVEDPEALERDGVRMFFEKARQEGKIRASGFSAHRNHIILLEKAMELRSFDVVMLPFNPFGAFKHSLSGWSTSWDQDRLITAMEKAQAAGIGIVAMKTCSGGPYAYREGEEPSLASAVRWVAEKPYISSAVVAMGNFKEVEEHTELFRFFRE